MRERSRTVEGEFGDDAARESGGTIGYGDRRVKLSQIP